MEVAESNYLRHARCTYILKDISRFRITHAPLNMLMIPSCLQASSASSTLSSCHRVINDMFNREGSFQVYHHAYVFLVFTLHISHPLRAFPLRFSGLHAA